MPKDTPQTKKIKDAEFLQALKETGSPKKAAIVVGNLGSQGGKNLDKVASVMGTKRLKRVNISVLEAMLKNGVTPDKIAKKTNVLLEAKKDI